MYPRAEQNSVVGSRGAGEVHGSSAVTVQRRLRHRNVRKDTFVHPSFSEGLQHILPDWRHVCLHRHLPVMHTYNYRELKAKVATVKVTEHTTHHPSCAAS